MMPLRLYQLWEFFLMASLSAGNYVQIIKSLPQVIAQVKQKLKSPLCAHSGHFVPSLE